MYSLVHQMKRWKTMLMACSLWLTGAVAAAQEDVDLHYFTWATGAATGHIQEDWIEPFTAMNPGVTITHEAVGFGEFWDKLPIYIATGNAPDIIHMSVGYVYDYAHRGLLENLQPYFDRDLSPDDIFMEPLKAMRYPDMESGDIYGMPYSFLLTSLYYNTIMFDDAGLGYPDETWTWDTLRGAAGRLVQDANADGTPDVHGFLSQPGYMLYDPLVHAFGGRILSADLSEVVLDSPEGIAAAEFLVDMIYEDGSARDGSLSLFTRQHAAMAVMSTVELPYLRSQGLNFDVALMPEGPAKRVVRLWPDSFAIPADAQHKELAWSFIRFAVTREEMDRYSGARKIPIYRDLALSQAWLEPDLMGDKMVFVNSIPHGEPLEFRPAWGNWEPRMRSELARAWRGEISPAAAVRQAADAIRIEIQRAQDES